ncbi:WD40-repeat-containing domain protein [Amylostereum chailletii]|nr:WD40-repeat-containing domain protein [Amylostereum chailletii]
MSLSPSSSSPSFLPIATIQHDFLDVLSDVYAGTVPSENVWLSCYKEGEPSVHGKVDVRLHQQDRELVVLNGRDGVQMERISNCRYRARCDSLGITSVNILNPTQTYADPIQSDARLPHQIPCFDISSSSSTTILASALSDGSVSLYELGPEASPRARSPYTPCPSHSTTPFAMGELHKSTITAIHILPRTSPVLVSAGFDFRIHVTPILPSSSTVMTLAPSNTLTGHTRAITSLIPLLDSAVISGGKEGTIRLWDIGTGQTAMWSTRGMCAPSAFASTGEDRNTVWTALADGSAQAFDVRARDSVATVEAAVTGSKSLNSAACDANGQRLVLGGSDGIVSEVDLRTISLRARWRRSGASVEALAILADGRTLVAGEDGLPYVVKSVDDVEVVEELVFGDVEATRCVRVRGDEAWISGDGGAVRRYSL